ncbi:MAG TPA: YkgJ family cysteine cluster protein [Candidatus Bathyarchaeia archaeon]|nr:YkgJ family cysteine cluster protein [Candidatus Bathyarchaeia archaeon]
MVVKRHAWQVRRGGKSHWSSASRSPPSYGHLFELGCNDGLRRTLATRVIQELAPSNGCANEHVLHLVDELVSERELGWRFRISPERLLDLRTNRELSGHLCADCAVPGCCYFETVRLTFDDVERLRARRGVTFEAFVTRHCVPYRNDRDACYTFALKQAQPCAFLSKDGRCSVYADRPSVCADFPFIVDRDTGDVTEIRLFPFCNVPFNVLRLEVTRRALEDPA